MDVLDKKSPNFQIRRSKYIMMLIFSFVDYSFEINTKILSQLNQQFRQISKSRHEESHNMLAKTAKIFTVANGEQV